MSRNILIGKEAKDFYNKITDNQKKFTDIGHAQTGGYWLSEFPGIYTAFDTTDGREVFIEDFHSVSEAAKYANGVMALTIDNILI